MLTLTLTLCPKRDGGLCKTTYYNIIRYIYYICIYMYVYLLTDFHRTHIHEHTENTNV